MTIKEIIYKNKEEWKHDQPRQYSSGFYDKFNVRIAEGVKVTWVSGNDDKKDVQPPHRQISQNAFIDELADSRGVRIIGRISAALRSAFHR